MSRRRILSAAAGAAALGMAQGAKSAAVLHRKIPGTGERIPVVGLGTYIAFDIERSHPEWKSAGEALNTFLDHGGRVVDSSPMYGRAEAAVGDLLTASRFGEKAFLATKIWTSDAAKGRAQAKQSAELLRRRQLDLLQVHNLLGLRAHLPFLRTLKESGQIRYIGVTHYHSSAYDDLERAIRGGGLDFVQVNYSVAEREVERRILPLAHDTGLAGLVNRPFAGGDLFGRLRARPLPAWAVEIECKSWAQLLLKFVLADTRVTCAIPGTRNPRHVLDNLAASLPPLPDVPIRRRILEAAQI